MTGELASDDVVAHDSVLCSVCVCEWGGRDLHPECSRGGLPGLCRSPYPLARGVAIRRCVMTSDRLSHSPRPVGRSLGSVPLERHRRLFVETRYQSRFRLNRSDPVQSPGSSAVVVNLAIRPGVWPLGLAPC